jgi:hypothetical protein
MEVDTEKHLLKVGDKIYRTHYDSITDIITIERTTKTQAISKDGRYRFKIETSASGYVYKMGDTDKWSSASFCLETEELKEQLFRQIAVMKLKIINYSQFSTDVLKLLLSLVDDHKKPTHGE